jgi:hypothetical protein
MSRRTYGATHEVIPSARRLIKSLRDLGYDFVHAVADLVDNSIAAGASRVDITVQFDGGASWVRITDNGEGMTGSTLTDAMRYGSDRRYTADDLGKFGLGLKTASMSQCRRLTVASRTDPRRRKLEVRVLDLDEIEKTDKWEVYDLDSSQRMEHLTLPLDDHTGTVVLWEELDRVLNYKVPWGERAKSGLLTLAERLDQHLGMVFHRFLAGEARRRRKLAITINGTAVEPWDPFARGEKHTEGLTAQEFELHTSSGKGTVGYRPYVLPPKQRFSSDTAFERVGGPARWNLQQGFYIYRADRMIQSGGWCRMRTADEHTKLARAALEFYPDLDSAFEINVAKIRVTLPPELRDQLKESVERLVRRAKTVYGRKDDAGSSGKGTHGVSSRRGGSSAQPARKAGAVRHVRVALEEAARKADEEEALKRIVRALRTDSPEVADELGW